MDQPPRRFDESEVEDILRRALARPDRAEGLSESELADIARQMGIAPETLAEAVDAHDVEAAVEAVRRAWVAERELLRARSLQSFSALALVSLAVNLVLSPMWLWSLWVVAAGLGVWVAQGYVLRRGPDPRLLQGVRAAAEAQAEAARRARAEAEESARAREVDAALGAAGQALSETLKVRVTGWLQGLNARLQPEETAAPLRGMSEAGAGAEAELGARGRVRIAAEPAAETAGATEAEVEAELAALRQRVARR
jgi:hypothetical protein